MATAQQDEQATSGDIALKHWNSPQWAVIRHAVYRTLLDMTVFPALDRNGVPLPNALHQTAVQHHLIDPTTSKPTDGLLWLNPHLRRERLPR